ncbi:MAG: hypothetical protein K1X72_22730 [Pyrinomonadaceae bacterium]|nr:hypothetical protein [Pyrinomonadaceae bacterium]
MNELDDIWQQMMEKAIANAHTTGRSDVAEYLALKATNDSIRSIGCQWIFDTFLELSEEVNRRGIRLDIENENPHRFAVGNSTMVGSLLRFKQGVRNLTVEAGWTRTPNDGFMRGGALAMARILHFGMSKNNAELLLIGSQNKTPQWFSVNKDGNRSGFDSEHLRQHFMIFLE